MKKKIKPIKELVIKISKWRSFYVVAALIIIFLSIVVFQNCGGLK